MRPGAPVIYGGFTSNVDMKSGAPAFGTPEYMKAVLVGGQLARRYNLPYRTSNTMRRQLGRRPGDVRIGVLALGRGHGPAATWSSTRPAGSRAACAPRSRSW